MLVVQSIVGHGSPAYVHIGEDAARQAINALPQGKSTLEKTDSQKLKEISEILSSKTVLTNTERKILATILD